MTLWQLIRAAIWSLFTVYLRPLFVGLWELCRDVFDAAKSLISPLFRRRGREAAPGLEEAATPSAEQPVGHRSEEAVRPGPEEPIEPSTEADTTSPRARVRSWVRAMLVLLAEGGWRLQWHRVLEGPKGMGRRLVPLLAWLRMPRAALERAFPSHPGSMVTRARNLRWTQVAAWTRGLRSNPRQWLAGLRSLEWSRVLQGGRGVGRRLAPRLLAYARSIRWRSWAAGVRRLLAEAIPWWRGLSRARRSAVAAGAVLVALVIPLAFFTVSGVMAAQDARQAYRDLQEELSHFTPVDLIQVNVYNSLEGRFREAEESSARARSRLAFLKAFSWVPVVGGQIKEVHRLLDIGFHQGRAGRNLAQVFGSAIADPPGDLSPQEASAAVARALQEAAPKLDQVQKDLRRVAELRADLGESERGERYGVLVDRYLGAIQTVAYLSYASPETIGHTYALSRELSALREMAQDPLDVLAGPEEIGKLLDHIKEQAGALEESLNLVRQATLANASGDLREEERKNVLELLDTLGPGVSLLRHATAGTRSLVTMADAIESAGFLSREFGEVVGRSVEEALRELTLARQETSSLQAILSFQGLDAEAFLPSVLFDRGSEFSLTPTERVEALLDEAISATNFLHSFLGYDGSRTYLLLGQNQNEIRASGGFIGIGVQATLDRGELTELVYHDSTTVDKEPLTENPQPPPALYWYLWMGNLLFRDANWNPHFPTAAAQVADIYRRGQNVQVDGVVTSTKLLAFDMVEIFGDVTVPEIEEPLNRLTAEAYSEAQRPYRCLDRHVSDRPKRCFDEDLFFALEDRLTSGVGAGARGRLVELVKEHLDMKNVMIHVFPPVKDSFLWEQGWNGAVPQVNHDYLMVVDSSLPGHSAASTQRSWEYSVSLDPDEPMEAHLRLRYENTEQPKDEVCLQFAWGLYHCYWNYFRVYLSPLSDDVQMAPIPLHEGSLKLIWGYPDPDSAVVIPSENPAKMTELGGFIPVEPGSVVTIPIEYRLPREVLRETAEGVFEYRLLIQKQPGMDRDLVSLAVELPDGAELLDTTPKFNSSRGSWYLFDFPLRADTTVVVVFKA